MIGGLDPSPYLLLATPLLALATFNAQRGLMKNKFWSRSRMSWKTYPTWSFGWWWLTFFNAVFLGTSIFVFYMFLFRGTEFSRPAVLPMPTLSGELLKEVRIRRSPQSLADCLSNLNFGRIYQPAPDHWRVAVRDSSNRVRTIFEIMPDSAGSRLGIYNVGGVTFVSWSRCSDPKDDGSGPSPWLEYQGGH